MEQSVVYELTLPNVSFSVACMLLVIEKTFSILKKYFVIAEVVFLPVYVWCGTLKILLGYSFSWI